MSKNFEPDEEIQKIAEAYALDAIDFASQQYGITLDWSDASVADVETILGRLHRSKPKDESSEDMVVMFSKMLGSYIGEVYRRNHGGDWGMVTLGGKRFAGMSASGRDELFWPWGKVRDRLENGDEDNVWHYYKGLTGAWSQEPWIVRLIRYLIRRLGLR